MLHFYILFKLILAYYLSWLYLMFVILFFGQNLTEVLGITDSIVIYQISYFLIHLSLKKIGVLFWHYYCLYLQTGRGLVVSWTLCAVCLLGHTAHLFQANAPSWMHALHSTGFHLSLSFFTLIGPGRQLILDGIRSLFKGSPNMNTLVGLGALSSFAVSSVAALIPKLVNRYSYPHKIWLLNYATLIWHESILVCVYPSLQM